jgi:aspartyl-tRNA synthetase
MVAGTDRYYQIARCLRDEDLRADRQFEFSQLDVEASFVGQADILDFVAEAVRDATEAVTGERPGEIATMTWAEADERFGSDKPDVRFGLELVDLTEAFAKTEARVFQAPAVKAILLPDGGSLTRSRLDALTELVKGWGGRGLAWLKVGAEELEGPVAKFVSADEAGALRTLTGAAAGDLLSSWRENGERSTTSSGCSASNSGAPPYPKAGCIICGSPNSHCSKASTSRGAQSPLTIRLPCPTPTIWTGWKPIHSTSAPRPTTWW